MSANAPLNDGNESPKLENDFLADMCRTGQDVTIFLVNGIKLQGKITAYNNNSLILTRAEHSQLVLRHAISTIAPEL